MFKRLGHCASVACGVWLCFGGAANARAQEAPTAPTQPPAALTAAQQPPAATRQTPAASAVRAPSAATTTQRAPKARPAVAGSGAAASPRAPLPALAPVAQRAAQAPPPPRQVVTVVHRLSGWKLLTWLAVSGPPALEIDKLPSASDVHTNIVAGFVSNDGRSVMARLPQAEAELETLEVPTF